MKAFRYDRPATVEAAVKALADGDALLKGNGLDVLDRLKERLEQPSRLVTLVDVPSLGAIERTKSGGLRIGAMVTLAQLASSKDVLAGAPAVAEAAAGAASPQLRNRATVGGNLAQHTRCGYYRLKTFPCFKRTGDPCPVKAPGAVQETAGVFGIDACASASPSSLAPAFGASSAEVIIVGAKGERRVGIAGLYEAPKQGKPSDTTLGLGDVIVAVELPAPGALTRAGWYEVRQRAAFDWALVSCAVEIEGGEEVVTDARVWLGSVAPIPYRCTAAEKALVGKHFSAALAASAGEAAVLGATPLPGTAYKLELIRVAVKRALLSAGERA